MTYLALSKTKPVVGEYLERYLRLDTSNGNVTWKEMVKSSRILSVFNISDETYSVHTRNSIYIVQVI